MRAVEPHVNVADGVEAEELDAAPARTADAASPKISGNLHQEAGEPWSDADTQVGAGPYAAVRSGR
jgi:hypothetical protein